jgi:hypothetical protein
VKLFRRVVSQLIFAISTRMIDGCTNIIYNVDKLLEEDKNEGFDLKT